VILLIGGTSDTAPLAQAMAVGGHKVLVSTATRVHLDIGSHPNIVRRMGILDQTGMSKLVQQVGIRAIVDASHPYAAEVRANAREVAGDLGLPYLSWVRPPAIPPGSAVHRATDHQAAGQMAFSFGAPVLITTGSKNLEPYTRRARERGLPLVARVLPRIESLEACKQAGIPRDHVVVGRGPFSVGENLELIRRFHIGVIVTKDSGVAGGVPAKLEAARLGNCQVVVVQRPEQVLGIQCRTITELLRALCTLLPP
jgi:precorrin-6A/cobalt-precorrin-6A reductase